MTYYTSIGYDTGIWSTDLEIFLCIPEIDRQTLSLLVEPRI
jgi:hypothetical protein